MKGVVRKYQGNRGCFWITGEDGVDYFSHDAELINCRRIQKDNIVEFKALEDQGKENLRAVNVRKIGLGPHHPFIPNIERAINAVQNSSDPSREYIIRDLQTIKNYFMHAQDFEWCKNPQSEFYERNDGAE